MNKMKRAIKRTLVYLICGFVMTWLVAWSLALLPRLTNAGYFNWSVRYSNPFHGLGDRAYPNGFVPTDPPPPELLTTMDSRWIGVHEVQFFVDAHAQDLAYIGTHVELSSPWWTLTTEKRQLSVNWQWTQLKEEFKTDAPEVQFTEYAILKYGLPFMSHESHAMSEQTNTHNSGWRDELSVNGIFAQTAPPITASVWNPRDQRVQFAELLYLPYAPLWPGLALNTLIYSFIFFILISTKRAFPHARRFRKGKCPICCYDLLFDNSLGCPECGWHKAKADA